MILLLLTIVPSLLWDEGPQTAPMLEKAGIHEISTTGDAAAWSVTRVHATAVDASRLVPLEAPGVDYQIGRAGATASPWVRSNLWRELKDPSESFLYEVTGRGVALAAAEAYSSGARAYLRIKQDDLATFSEMVRFLRQIDGPAMPPRVNLEVLKDGRTEIDEVMNLLVRRNLLFQPVHSAGEWKGPVVRIGTPEYPSELASDPYRFAALVRSRIRDDRRLVRVYGSDTVIARLYGDERHSRLHLLQYGSRPVRGLRVRVLGRYGRILIASPGKGIIVAQDPAQDATATEFTLPEVQSYAIVDLDSARPGTLVSSWSNRDFELTADPRSRQWRTASPVQLNRNAFGAPLAIGPTQVRSRWTRDSLYLLYVCPFDSVYLKPDPVTDRETPQLWNWDVAEAFIGAEAQNIGQYREFQVSPQGEFVDLDIDVLTPKPGGGMGWNSGFEVKARIDQSAKVWYGEMRIPLASISAQPLKRGDRLRLGLFRITGLPDRRELVAWQPSFRRNFHVPEAFGSLVLEGSNN